MKGDRVGMKGDRVGMKGDSHQIWGIQVTVASLMIVSSVFHEAESSIQPQSLGRVCDPVGIAEGPTAIDAAPHRLHSLPFAVG